MPAVTPLNQPPPRATSADPAYTSDMDAFLAQWPTMVNEINAFAASLNLASTTSASTTSLGISAASKTLIVEPAKSYVAGQTLKIAATASPSNWMLGDVTSYNVVTGQLIVAVQWVQGSGTFAAWTISLSPPAPVTIPAGSKMLFYNAAAPDGWVQVTSLTGGYALRMVSGAGGVAVGTLAFTDAFKSQAVAGTNSAVTLTKAMIPKHTHLSGRASGASVSAGGNPITTGTVPQDVASEDGTATGLSSGGIASHNHVFTGTAIDLAVKYIDVILATKQ